jgi:hypothetical protein
MGTREQDSPSISIYTSETFKALKVIKSALKICHSDPNFECSLKVISGIKNDYACYRDIFYEKKKAPSVQTSSDSYFKNPLQVQSGEKNPNSQSSDERTNISESSAPSVARSLYFANPGNPVAVPSHSVFVQ